MSTCIFNVWKQFRFDAAHHLDGGPDTDPKYRRVHGHSYQVDVWLRGPRTEFGWVVDMGELEARLQTARDLLDHRYLNEIEGLGPPTMENIAHLVWMSLRALPQLHRVVVKREQNGEGCEYFGPAADVTHAA